MLTITHIVCYVRCRDCRAAGPGRLRLGGDLWRVGPLCGRSAAVVDAGGDVSGAGNSVTVDSTVELDDCGLGGHGGMTVLH